MLDSERRVLFGCLETLAPRQYLQAGPVSLIRQGTRWGPICVHGHEVWHGVEFLLRDTGWGTPATVLDSEQLLTDEKGFELQVQAHIPCLAQDVIGSWDSQARLLLEIRVRGNALGGLEFSVQATPTHDTLVNRCGWVVMHPLTAAGCAVQVSHADGRISQSQLPQEVPAWPPFTAMKGISHEYAPGYWAKAEFSGEDYELEDQRNNADASFKTYSRSNAMPRPFLLRQQQSWRRELSLHLADIAPANPSPTLKVDEKLETPCSKTTTEGFLRLGLAITAPIQHPVEPVFLTKLSRWQPDFLHLTLWPSITVDDVDWSQVRLMLDAAKSSLRIDICARDQSQPEWSGDDTNFAQAMAQAMAQAGVVPHEVASLPCGERAAQFLRSLFPSSAIGGGTPHFFAQLNRLDRSGGEDFMAFTVCPIVHSAEDTSVMQGLQSLPSMLETARRRHPGTQWHLGPSGLAARASPLGRQATSDGSKRIPLASVDPRSQGIFGAAWLLGHMAGATQAGVNALTLPALTVRQSSEGHAQGARWVSPTEAMMEVCLPWRGVQAMALEPKHQPGSNLLFTPMAAVMGFASTRRQILLANLTEQCQTLHWHHAGQWASLDAQSWLRYEALPHCSPWADRGACTAQLELQPYALARVDLSS